MQQWRIAWDVVVNKHLERAGSEERIDHRSHADRGKADEVIDNLDIKFMPAVKEKPSRSKEQQRTKETQKSKPKREKGPEMAL